MNIFSFSLVLANASLLATAASVQTAPAKSLFPFRDLGIMSSLKDAGNQFQTMVTGTGKKNETGEVKLERIMACSETSSKEKFIEAIQSYSNLANVPQQNNFEQVASNEVKSSEQPASNHSAIRKDFNLSSHDLALKKLNVLFNCPKANSLLAELNEEDQKILKGLPIAMEALKQKLLQFPYGSLQLDYDRTIKACVQSINEADHNDICKMNPCKQEDLDQLQNNLVKLNFCSHDFMKETIDKIVKSVRNEVKMVNEKGVQRSQFLKIVSKVANTLPKLQVATGILVNESLLEKTNIKCRANLQKLLSSPDVDVPPYGAELDSDVNKTNNEPVMTVPVDHVNPATNVNNNESTITGSNKV